MVEGDGPCARGDGTLWGETSPVTCHSPTIYADIHLAAGGSDADRPEAEERGALCGRGRGVARRHGARAEALYVLRPGVRATLRSARGGQVMLCGGARSTGRATSGGTSSRRAATGSAGQGGLEGGRFALPPDDHEEFIPLPEVPRRSAIRELKTAASNRQPADRRHAERRARRARGGEPIILLHGFPGIAPHLARRRRARRRPFRDRADQRGFAASDKPEGVEAYRPTGSSRICSRSPMRSVSSASPWSATIGAARRLAGGAAPSRPDRPAGDRQRAAPARLPEVRDRG